MQEVSYAGSLQLTAQLNPLLNGIAMSLKDRFAKELRDLQELGREFAEDNPQLAPFLGPGASDPDVARLMEGFAFLTAKLAMKIEDDLPELTHPLLQMVAPNALRPLPSTTLMRFEPVQHALSGSQIIPKGTLLHARPVNGVNCTFRTCTDVHLHPMVVSSASVSHSVQKSVISLELQALSQQPWNQINCDRLDFHLGVNNANALVVYQWLSQHLKRISLGIGDHQLSLPPNILSFAGFDPDDALLPGFAPHQNGYRLLQEYFCFPERFHGFTLKGLKRHWPEQTSETVRLELHFSRPMPTFVEVSPETFCLYCTPAINLFEHAAEPILLDGAELNQIVRPRTRRPQAYSIFSVDRVSARQRDPESIQPERHFEPYQSLVHRVETASEQEAAYYNLTIEPELLTQQARHTLSLIHGNQRPYLGQREELNIALTCTNNDLPQQLEIGDICLVTQTTPPFATYRNLTRPTRQYPPVFDGETHWALISNLSLNRLSLTSPAALKAVLQVYDFIAPHDLQHQRATQHRLEGIKKVSNQPTDYVFKGIPMRGSQTTLCVDPAAFSGEGDLQVFGSVLSHFMALYASNQSFHLLHMVNIARDSEFTWPVQTGQQANI